MSQKRKLIEERFRRCVRIQREFSKDTESFKSLQLDPKIEGSKLANSDRESSSSHTDSDGESVKKDDSLDLHVEAAASISFGALAKAQSELDVPEKSHPKTVIKSTNTSDKYLRKSEQLLSKEKPYRDLHRPNSHAPMEISSKKAVSRRRDVVPVIKRQARDPRFEPLGASLQAITLTKAYSFLDDYRENEMKELKEAIKVTKDIKKKEELKKTLLVMESKKKTKLRKLKEQEVLDRHRKQEKALVKQGKKPFYLKKSEQKKQILLDQFNELKGKKLDRVIERRRRKLESKMKKKMPPPIRLQ